MDRINKMKIIFIKISQLIIYFHKLLVLEVQEIQILEDNDKIGIIMVNYRWKEFNFNEIIEIILKNKLYNNIYFFIKFIKNNLNFTKIIKIYLSIILYFSLET